MNIKELYKVYYQGKDANYPAFETKEEALRFYLKEVAAATGESYEEILSEEYKGGKAVEVVKVEA